MISTAETVNQSRWTLWTSTMRGEARVAQLVQFDTPAEAIQGLIKDHPVSELADKTYLHIFRNGIQPLWEDPHNSKGGHFKLVATSPTQSETMWLSVVVRFLEEDFAGCDSVNGVSVMANQVGNNLLKVWLSHAEKGVLRRIRSFLRCVLHPGDFLTVSFVPHKLVVKGASKKIGSCTEHCGITRLVAPQTTSSDESDTSSSDGTGECFSVATPDGSRTPVEADVEAEMYTPRLMYTRNPYSLSTPIVYFFAAD